MILTCTCGIIIPDEYIDYSNRCNEEGEEYGETSAYCNVCKKEHETSQWGEFESKEEAIELLIEYIKPKQYE